MLICAACGQTEPEGAQFCGNCGAPLVPTEQQAVGTTMTSAATLTCANCGHEEPEGSRFCGSCGTPYRQVVPETPSPRLETEQPVRVAPPPAPAKNRALRWIAAGGAVALLVAGVAVAGALALSDGDDGPEATPTEPLPAATSESLPSVPNPTLVDGMQPHFVELVGYQGALSARIRSLTADVQSFAALRRAAAALRTRVVGAQDSLDGLTATDSSDANARSMLGSALTAHLAYAEAVSGFPRRPRLFTNAHAQTALARADQVNSAYALLAAAEPAMSGISLNSADHVRLLELVPPTKPPLSIATRRVIDLVPLLVGIRPDDPPSEGRCFGPYSGASLRVSGVVYRSGFIQCGDDAQGDPTRATGVYRFSGLRLPAGSSLVRITAQPVIDEFSSPSQRGSRVTWTVFYDSAPICSAAVTWSGSRPPPGNLDCRFPSGVASSDGFDLRRLRVQQDATLASAGTFWSGLFHPSIVVEVPR